MASNAKIAAPKAYPNPAAEKAPHQPALSMSPPLQPQLQLQLRTLARHLHNTSRNPVKPHLRPAASIRNQQKHQEWAARKPPIPEEVMIPTDIIMSAHKSKVLPFGPAAVTNLVTSYTSALERPPSESVGKAICDEHKIAPHDLTLLALVFIRSASPKDTPERLRFGLHLLSTCSALHDPTATIELHRYLTKARQTPQTMNALRDVVQRLTKIASKDEHPGALFRMGEVLVSQPGKMAEAEKCFRRAAEQGVGEAWTRVGQLQLARRSKEEAMVSFKKGVELDNPHAYHYLAINTDPSSPAHESYLLKAAASGVIEAAHNLGVYYHSIPNSLLAHEWYTLAATEGFSPSQVNLANILRKEGKLSAAVEWLTKASKEPGAVRADAERMRKEIEMEIGQVAQEGREGSC